MSDGIDLHALDNLLAKAAAACDALDARLETRRNEPGVDYNQRLLRAELRDDLMRAHNVIRRIRSELRALHVTATDTATSRDVAPETTEAQP